MPSISIENMTDELLAANDRLIESLKNIHHQDKESITNQWMSETETILLPVTQETLSKIDIWVLMDNLLKKFSDASIGKKLGLVICDASISPDVDIINVMEMMLLHATDKNKSYLFIAPNFSKYINTNSKIICTTSLDSISFLGHWSLRTANLKHATSKIPNYILEADKMAGLIRKIPNVEMVILRGCSTVGEFPNTKIFNPKKIQVVGSRIEITTVFTDDAFPADTLLFQQHVDQGKVITTVRYLNLLTNEVEQKNITNIPLNSTGNKLEASVEKALATVANENDLPLLAFQTDEMKNLVKMLKLKWITNEAIDKTDKRILQATDKQARTFKITSFRARSLKASLAHALEEALATINMHPIIKSYGGVYKGYKSGARGSENILPKAIKKR